MSSLPNKGRKGQGSSGNSGRSTSSIAFEDRDPVVGEIFNSVLSELRDVNGEPKESSYPHLTHEPERKKKSDPPGRPAHVTSSRVFDVVGQFVIHQRFHQNEDRQSAPTHDRFFAVDSETGNVHDVTATLADVHQKKNAKLPRRGQTLEDTTIPKLSFTVNEPNESHPPLSPRSIGRKVRNSGY
ncbi:hypothetical protein [Undibacterium sp. Xuan67W]|uniref:hypothetical protein n=1 Tax=Undibacterium sp. Xuan67W TaxID=3413057 RepID=UPI003BF28985